MQMSEMCGVALRSALLVMLGLQPLVAEAEKGRFQGHAVLEGTKFAAFDAQPGHPMKAAMAGENDGLMFHNGGGSALDRMLDRVHYSVVWVGDGAGSGHCMKTFTTKEGHKLYARCDFANATSKGSSGTVTLLGGTGPFQGIKGKGKYNFVGVTDRVFWDDIEWEWETP